MDETNMHDRNDSNRRRALKNVRWTVVFILTFLFITGFLWFFTFAHCSFFVINGVGVGIFSRESDAISKIPLIRSCTLYHEIEKEEFFHRPQTIGQMFALIGFSFHSVAVMIVILIILISETQYNSQMSSSATLQDSISSTIDYSSGPLTSTAFKTTASDSLTSNKTKKKPTTKTFKNLWNFMRLLLVLSCLLLLTTFSFGLNICFNMQDDYYASQNTTTSMYASINPFQNPDHGQGDTNTCKPGAAGIAAIINAILLFELIILSFCVNPAPILFPTINKNVTNENSNNIEQNIYSSRRFLDIDLGYSDPQPRATESFPRRQLRRLSNHSGMYSATSGASLVDSVTSDYTGDPYGGQPVERKASLPRRALRRLSMGSGIQSETSGLTGVHSGTDYNPNSTNHDSMMSFESVYDDEDEEEVNSQYGNSSKQNFFRKINRSKNRDSMITLPGGDEKNNILKQLGYYDDQEKEDTSNLIGLSLEVPLTTDVEGRDSVQVSENLKKKRRKGRRFSM